MSMVIRDADLMNDFADWGAATSRGWLLPTSRDEDCFELLTYFGRLRDRRSDNPDQTLRIHFKVNGRFEYDSMPWDTAHWGSDKSSLPWVWRENLLTEPLFYTISKILSWADWTGWSYYMMKLLAIRSIDNRGDGIVRPGDMLVGIAMTIVQSAFFSIHGMPGHQWRRQLVEEEFFLRLGSYPSIKQKELDLARRYFWGPFGVNAFRSLMDRLDRGRGPRMIRYAGVYFRGGLVRSEIDMETVGAWLASCALKLRAMQIKTNRGIEGYISDRGVRDLARYTRRYY